MLNKTPVVPSATLYEYVGNLHNHTPYSDGEASHVQIAEAARLAGIDFVIVTDHNVLVKGVEGYYGSETENYVLILTGEEIHDQAREPQVNHLLVYGAGRELAQCAVKPQELINAVNAAGGFCFIAHPFDPPLTTFKEIQIPWVDWNVTGFAGLEIWNFMSDFKAAVKDLSKLEVIRAVFAPEKVVIGPRSETLALWDKLLTNGQHVTGIGNADAHGTVFHMGPLQHTIFPYDFLYNCVNTHVLLPQQFSGNWQQDRQMIYRALKQGNCFIGYDIPGSTRGFRFSATGMFGSTIMGGTVRLGPGVTLQALAPARSHIKIICNGVVVAETKGWENLTHTAQAPGAYRAEVWLDYEGKERCWILSNPIYVEDTSFAL